LLVARIDTFMWWLTINYAGPAFIVFAVFILAIHFFAKQTKFPMFVLAALFLVVVLIFAILAITPEPISFGRLAAILFLYGSLSFILISTALQNGLAAWLTRKRGEHWVKELDYVYLAIGSIGVLATVNRLPFITDKIEAGDLIAPVIITTAIVIRLIKTRAEIGGWNKI
jgi:hypothetical protein